MLDLGPSYWWHAGSDPHLRPYLPNIDFADVEVADKAAAGITAGAISKTAGRGLALVALRDISDEEILLNYR